MNGHNGNGDGEMKGNEGGEDVSSKFVSLRKRLGLVMVILVLGSAVFFVVVVVV